MAIGYSNASRAITPLIGPSTRACPGGTGGMASRTTMAAVPATIAMKPRAEAASAIGISGLIEIGVFTIGTTPVLPLAARSRRPVKMQARHGRARTEFPCHRRTRLQNRPQNPKRFDLYTFRRRTGRSFAAIAANAGRPCSCAAHRARGIDVCRGLPKTDSVR